MKSTITAVLFLAIGMALGVGINIVSAQDDQVSARWQFTNVVTSQGGIGGTFFYILRYDDISGEVWISREGKPFEQIQEK